MITARDRLQSLQPASSQVCSVKTLSDFAPLAGCTRKTPWGPAEYILQVSSGIFVWSGGTGSCHQRNKLRRRLGRREKPSRHMMMPRLEG